MLAPERQMTLRLIESAEGLIVFEIVIALLAKPIVPFIKKI